MTEQSTQRTLTEEHLARLLNAQVVAYARAGWRVSSLVPRQAIAQRPFPVGGNLFWFVTVLLVVFTAGLWLVVLAFQFLDRGLETRIISIDDYGQIHLS